MQMRRQNLFNEGWLFLNEEVGLDADDNLFQKVTLPHSNKLFSHQNIDNKEYQFISTYRKYFSHPGDLSGARVVLEFQGVMLASRVYLNDSLVGEYLGGFTPHKINLTEYLQQGDNCLTVYVDSRERKDIPPFGHLVDYLTFGGIYRDVIFSILPENHIQNTFLKPSNILEKPQLTCEVELSQEVESARVEVILRDEDGAQIAQAHCQPNTQKAVVEFRSLSEIRLWDVEDPVLYQAEVSLYGRDQLEDRTITRFGFREAEFRSDGGFYLNGRRLQLFGLNRHQTYPYIGAAAPNRLQRRDAEILKFELGCNIVRTSHYPQSPHFLDRCDEIGLLVFEEITGWQHIGDQQWQDLVLDELKTMIERDRNHPSIILWGVRINESADHDLLYTETNHLAHTLDPTRQTGGVRCFQESSFLEDVFTYNDFSNSVVEPVQIPYLITEFAGHMFPTKIWDHEERLIDQALLHADIHNQQMGNTKVSGAIGWCAFDYATHIEFGSGNRVCYHGVMDIFRLPKWAAYFYKSQLPPEKEVVLQAATHWTMGDRSGGGNNPLTIFSNCDEVEVVIGENQVGRFKPDFKAYPHLAHPPIVVEGLDQYSAWGQREFYDLKLSGYLNGQAVAEQIISSNRLPTKLVFTADDQILTADGSDMTRLALKVTDEFCNPLPYAAQSVRFKVDGEADLIGNNPFLLMGGQGAVYLKTRHSAGQVTVWADTDDLPAVSLTITLTESDKTPLD
jgi:beta-galactosidase